MAVSDAGVATVKAAGVIEWRGMTYATDTGTHPVGAQVAVQQEGRRIVVVGVGGGGGSALPPPGRLPKVYYQDFRPGTTVGVDAVEADYWIRPPTGSLADIAPADVLTNTALWAVLGFGYPLGASISAGQDGMSLVWAANGVNGQQAAFAVPFVNDRVYLAEVTVSPLTGAATRARIVWGFTQDGGVVTLTPGQDTVLRMFIPWHTGMNHFVMIQGDDTANGGGVLVKSAKVLDVTEHRGEQFVLDDVMGWIPVGDGRGSPGGGGGGGAPMGSVIAYALPTIPAGWLLCDGSPVDAGAYPDLHAVMATTPDLRNQFIRGGAATDLTPKGAASVTLAVANMPAHSHGGTTQAANVDHQHGFDHGHTASTQGGGAHGHVADYSATDTSGISNPSAIDAGNNSSAQASNIRNMGGGDHNHGITVNNFTGWTSGQNQNHLHAINAEGGGQAFSVLPPHVVLAYIIKATP